MLIILSVKYCRITLIVLLSDYASVLDVATCTLPFTVGGALVAWAQAAVPASEAGHALGHRVQGTPGSCRQGRCLGLVLPLGNFCIMYKLASNNDIYWIYFIQRGCINDV